MEILYRTAALGIEKEADGWAVRTAGGLVKADAVVVSVDARTAIDKLFAEPLQDGWARKMRKGLGLKTSLSEWPRSMQVVLKTPDEGLTPYPI